MICKNCGAQIEDDALFCPECGARQDAGNGPAPGSGRPEDNGQAMDMGQNAGTGPAPGNDQAADMGQGMAADNEQPAGQGPALYTQDSRSDEGLKYTAGLVQPGHAPAGGGRRESAPRPRKKRGGRAVFILLCAVIGVLTCVITWEILDLISINRGGNDFKAPALKSEYVSESGASSAASSVTGSAASETTGSDAASSN
ncbi:MAG: zinc ribbon domain-containing protein [Eubacteriales bacterium]|nr:zinc ribbon domain-containing protein [Eubacteriales bacterium]